jgi:drug/metabolite transporter (DMT)-like permease
MSDKVAPAAPAVWLVGAALATVYLMWGGVYLAIAFAIETIPPFMMMGTRLMVAGVIAYGWALGGGVVPPTRDVWKRTAVPGALMMFGGVGVGAWAQQWVPSGLTAVLIGTVPLWLVLLDWAFSGPRPGGWLVVGLLMGLVGIALIVGPDALRTGDGSGRLFGALVMVAAAIGWASGSLYTIRVHQHESVLLVTGMQMLIGGAMLLAAAAISGEIAQFDADFVTRRSVLAMAFLVVFPGILAFSAYTWLLRVTAPVLAASYAYVTPVVALFLGWAVGGETLTARMLAGAAIILAGVALITTRRIASPDTEEVAQAASSSA